MSADDVIDVAVDHVADGKPVDWNALAARVGNDDERERLECLRILAAIAGLHRSADHAPYEPSAVGPGVDPTPATATSDVSPGETWGRYTLLEKVGAGTFGSVYRAWDPELEFELAIKILHGDADARLKERLLREGRALAKVRDPNVVSVYGVESHGERVGLCMEFIHGETLEDVLRHRQTLSAREAALVGQDVCRALGAVHRAGFVHRDVKARNIMRERAGRIVLMDFGTGRDIDDLENAPGPLNVAGTPLYMAPEVLAGQPASFCSDVYSVGVLLYHLVTGRYPIEGHSLADIRSAHMLGKRTPISDHRSDLPTTFISVIDRTLTPNPQQRCATAGELLEALSADGDDRGRRGLRTRTVLGAVLAAIALTGAIALGVRSNRRPPPLTERDTIVLADFVNSTGDPVFDDTLKVGLKIQLRQSPFLNVLPDESVAEVLKLMGRGSSDGLTADLARDLCLRTKSKAMLTGTIATLGSHYVIGLRAQDCVLRADLAQEQVEAPRKEDVLKALDRAAASVRGTLGESLSTVKKYDAPLEQVTTPSLEALRAYSLGEKTFQERGDAASLVFFKRAVELDPQFAMAYVHLGGTYANLSQSRAAIESFEKAYALRDRASERERYRIASEYFIFVTGELEKANLVFEDWVRTYPRDFKAFGRLARNYLSLGQLEQSVAPSLEALRLSPGAISHSVNLIYIYLALNRPIDAEAVYERAIAQQPDHTRLHTTRYAIAFYEGDADEMHRQAELVAGRPGDENQQLSYQADTEAYFGHLRQAGVLARHAAAIAERNDQSEAAAIHLLNAALNKAEVGQVSAARELSTTALRLASSHNVRVLAALALSRSGDIERATALASELTRSLPRSTPIQNYWLPVIRASMALSRSESAAAMDLLSTARGYELGVPEPDSHLNGTLYPAYVRGEAYLKLGRGPEAAAEFQKIIDHRGIVLNFIVGALANLQLGRAKAQSGDRKGARQAYDRFFEIWKDADPDVPILQSARAEYVSLQ